MRLCLFSGKQLEDTFENAQRRKTTQMHPMWLCLFPGRRFEATFENTQNTAKSPLKRSLWWHIWKIIFQWKCTVEKKLCYQQKRQRVESTYMHRIMESFFKQFKPTFCSGFVVKIIFKNLLVFWGNFIKTTRIYIRYLSGVYQSCKMSQIWQIYLCKNIEKLG